MPAATRKRLPVALASASIIIGVGHDTDKDHSAPMATTSWASTWTKRSPPSNCTLPTDPVVSTCIIRPFSFSSFLPRILTFSPLRRTSLSERATDMVPPSSFTQTRPQSSTLPVSPLNGPSIVSSTGVPLWKADRPACESHIGPSWSYIKAIPISSSVASSRTAGPSFSDETIPFSRYLKGPARTLSPSISTSHGSNCTHVKPSLCSSLGSVSNLPLTPLYLPAMILTSARLMT
mmetsp:Transcript_44339/g.134394  ORF Transcript_44339/g.134394 Transcript_44339/m.134394 type:complete len:234 (+) Transcript_44339:142-843(+)